MCECAYVMKFTSSQWMSIEAQRRHNTKGWNYSSYKTSAMKMTINTGSTINPRIHRKVLRVPAKRQPGKALPGKLHSIAKIGNGKLTPGKRIIQRPNPTSCDNSNDSGLGLDQHVETQYHNHHTPSSRPVPSIRSKQINFDERLHNHLHHNNSQNNQYNINNKRDSDEIEDEKSVNIKSKRHKIDNIDIESDDACSNDAFILSAQRQKENVNIKIPTASTVKVDSSLETTATITSETSATANNTSLKLLNSSLSKGVPRTQQRRLGGIVTLQTQISTVSRNGTNQLQILVQPEQQHRARYQTEGSRGAVKDRSGNGFPIVKLVGYNKPTVLQVFIGTDIGRVSPHMFYQACKVSGKNSTPCLEKKVDGTNVIEVDLKPENDMTVTCDCVGILKERNVDVEHRFPEQSGPRSKKKSTRCRMVFRTIITNDDGSIETLQVCSQQIICTQPPGVPEICKKSLVSCPANGKLELFIIGKNFLKDTRIVFQELRSCNGNETAALDLIWEDNVIPDKEYLQQTHLVCTVPPYVNPDITEPVNIQIYVISSGKKSESHNFMYTPIDAHYIAASTSYCTQQATPPTPTQQQQDVRYSDESVGNSARSVVLWNSGVEPTSELDSGMMPPPSALPIGVRRPSSAGQLIQDQLSPPVGLKSELMDENSQNSVVDVLTSDYQGSNETSVDASALKDMIYKNQNIQERMDLIEENSNISMIVSENSMDCNTMPIQNFTTHNHNHLAAMIQTELSTNDIIGLRIKQREQLTEHLHQYEQTRSNYLSNLEDNVNQLQAETVALFANAQQQQSPTGVLQQLTNMNQLNSATNPSMDQPFLGNLCSDASAVQLTQILDLPQNSNSPEIDDSMIGSNSSRSPLTQDIILNSQSVVTLNNSNGGLSVLTQNSTNSPPAHNMSPDIILNPAVSPTTMMCQTSPEQSNILCTPVTMGNPMLNVMTMSQSTQNNLLNNLIPPVVMSQQSDDVHLSHKTPVAVKNMYLNVANEILTTQPTVTTMNALISMDTAAILNDQHHQQQQQVVDKLLSSPMILQQNPTNNQNDNNLCRNQNVIEQQIAMYNDTNNIHHQIMNTTNLTQSSSGMINNALNNLSNEILNQEIVNEEQIRVQEEFLRATNNQINGTIQQDIHNNVVTQESILQAVSLVRNELSDTKVVDQVNIQSTSTAATTIPQELTAMSDHDLLSYINTSCFDQM